MGVSPLHAADQITAFLGDGETRLIAAAYRDVARSAELFVLPDGHANEVRQWTKDDLRCMFVDCPAPDLTTVSRRRGRDGFRHGAGGGKHAPESVNHRQGKAVVADWLRGLYGEERVFVEDATDTQRSNVADVLLKHPAGRVAFEVQYAPLTVAEWRRRHESYAQQGIIDVWLWGHTRVRQSKSQYASAPYRLDDVQEELREAGMRVTFLNPETAQIGVASDTWRDRACLPLQREYTLAVESLPSVRMSAHGLTSPLIAALAAVSAERRAEIVARLVEQRRRRQQLEPIVAERLAAQEAQRAEELRAWKAVQEAARLAAPRRIDTPRTAENRVCRMCGLPLAEFITSGVHIGQCEERDRHRKLMTPPPKVMLPEAETLWELP